MTADLPTHPSTEAVGEVRRLPVALDPPTPTLAERAQERRREVGETWHDPATYTHTSAGAPWVVDRDGPLARSLRTDGWLDPAAAKALIEELTETRGALAAEEEDRRDTYDEFEKLRSDLSAMISDRDWLRGEFERVTAEAANLWGEREAAMRNWIHIQDEWERALPLIYAAEAWAFAIFGADLKLLDGDEDLHGPAELDLRAAVETWQNAIKEADAWPSSRSSPSSAADSGGG